MAEITLAATVENIGVVTEFVTEQLDELGWPMKRQMRFSIVVDEIVANIAQYAYPDGSGMVTVQVASKEDGNLAVVTFIDQGIPYNPLEKEDPDVTLPVAERPIGGLGIFMVKKIMDDMIYRYEDGQNILSLVKRIG